eukprot:3719850-Amphidinium_carterae.1
MIMWPFIVPRCFRHVGALPCQASAYVVLMRYRHFGLGAPVGHSILVRARCHPNAGVGRYLGVVRPDVDEDVAMSRHSPDFPSSSASCKCLCHSCVGMVRQVVTTGCQQSDAQVLWCFVALVELLLIQRHTPY